MIAKQPMMNLKTHIQRRNIQIDPHQISIIDYLLIKSNVDPSQDVKISNEFEVT